MILWRPVGLNELRLIYHSGMTAFPPRLPDQPIFYSVLNADYAAEIARDWNTRTPPFAGYVTRFEVDDSEAGRYDRQVVGGRRHEELWVPAEDLAGFNAAISPPILVTTAYFGPEFRGAVPAVGDFAGMSATDQLAAIKRSLNEGGDALERWFVEDHETHFLNFAFWAETLGRGEARGNELVATLRKAWNNRFPTLPLPGSLPA